MYRANNHPADASATASAAAAGGGGGGGGGAENESAAAEEVVDELEVSTPAAAEGLGLPSGDVCSFCNGEPGIDGCRFCKQAEDVVESVGMVAPPTKPKAVEPEQV